jgi:hypothetical protein
MANTLLTIGMVTKETLRVLVNNLTFTKHVNREYSSEFAVTGAKIGSIVNVRKPVRPLVYKGQALQIQDATESQVPVALTDQAQVGMEFSSQNLTLDIDEYSDRFIAPAAAAIANQIDYDGLATYNQVANAVGTPGTTPNALLTYNLAATALDNEAAPNDDQRSIVITSLMQSTIVDALKGLFQASQAIADQYRRGAMGTAAGFDWYMDQNCATHTVGALGGTPLVNGASQTGSSLITDGWTGAVATRLLKGDIFTIGATSTSIYGVNPQSRASTGQLRQFVVTADTASDVSGNMTIPIYPAITPSGQFQTVSASPANDATINVLGAANTASPQGLAFHRDAFTLATADLYMPDGAGKAYRVNSKVAGISLRVIRDYLIMSDQEPVRVDVLYGWAALRPELACRICG